METWDGAENVSLNYPFSSPIRFFQELPSEKDNRSHPEDGGQIGEGPGKEGQEILPREGNVGCGCT